MTMSTRRATTFVLAMLLVAGAVAFTDGGSASAEAFHNSAIKVNTPLRTCTNTSDASCNGWKTLTAGTTVAMRCWYKQGPATDPKNYGTDMFFWVDSPDGQGFVSANHVKNQWLSSPYCGDKPNVRAVRWAGAWRTQTDYQLQCLKFVADAWRSVGKTICSWCNSSTTAYQYWLNPRAGTKTATTTNFNPPVGAAVFWNTAVGSAGHVAISIGDGYVISTRFGGRNDIRVFNLKSYTKGYVGWIQY